MKHRERVEMALNHEEPDRCPMQISYTPEFKKRLIENIKQLNPKYSVEMDNLKPFDLECALDQDMFLTWSGRLSETYETSRQDLKEGISIDEWGIVRKEVQYQTRFGMGSYTEMIEHPLEDETKVDAYKPPDPKDPDLYLEAEQLIRDFKGEYWIVGCAVTTIFETAWALRGYENLLMDFAINPDLVEKILDIPYKYNFEVAKKMTELDVDMIWFGDDVGAQNAMLMSPQTWREFFKPRMASLFSKIKEMNPNLKIAYHSDGYIVPIIPDLIEIGLDVLNPIQPKSMDPEKLKQEFGDKLSFWGAIDEQYTLPFGKPEDVKKEILTLLKTMGKKGGLILAPTHNVQLDTPMENFSMMVDTIRFTSY